MIWPVSADKYLAYLTVMAAMSVMPGPAMLFAVAAGMNKGIKGVLLAAAGMNAAALVWFAASAAGLMVVATTMPWIFRIVAWLGVGYIVWLGIDALRGALRAEAPPPRAMRAPGLSIFRDGFVVQASNPKAILFLTAIVPPFVEVSRPVWPQMGAFALGMVTMDAAVMLVYGLLGAAFAHRMAEPRFRRGFALFVGAVLLLVAALMIQRLA